MAYKYYVKTDKNKETVGTVNAPSDRNRTIENAAQNLNNYLLRAFIKIFKVRKTHNMENSYTRWLEIQEEEKQRKGRRVYRS